MVCCTCVLVELGRFLTSSYAVLMFGDTSSNFSSCFADVLGVTVSTINLINNICVVFQTTFIFKFGQFWLQRVGWFVTQFHIIALQHSLYSFWCTSYVWSRYVSSRLVFLSILIISTILFYTVLLTEGSRITIILEIVLNYLFFFSKYFTVGTQLCCSVRQRSCNASLMRRRVVAPEIEIFSCVCLFSVYTELETTRWQPLDV